MKLKTDFHKLQPQLTAEPPASASKLFFLSPISELFFSSGKREGRKIGTKEAVESACILLTFSQQFLNLEVKILAG